MIRSSRFEPARRFGRLRCYSTNVFLRLLPEALACDFRTPPVGFRCLSGPLDSGWRHLLQRAGAHSGSLYHYFPGKQEVLIAVLDMYCSGIDEMLLSPVWKDVPDPIDRVFALLAKYREHILATECTYGCPIGSLALELHEPDPPVRERLAANFRAWTDAIRGCLRAAGPRLPKRVDTTRLSTFVLTTMEGGVMLARTYRDVAPFDAAVGELRDHFDRLLGEAAAKPRRKPASGIGRRGSR